MHAIQLAQMTRINTIIVPENFMYMKRNLTTKSGIRIIQTKYGSQFDCPYRKFYRYLDEAPPLNVSIVEEFRDTYLEHFVRPPPLPNGSLVVHIRSGDIFNTFKKWKYPNYAQPPCSFYKTVMDKRNWSHIEVLAFDNSNPCLDYVRQLGAKWNQRDARSDIATVINAEYLVAAKGTFDMACAMLSTNLKELYVYNMREKWMGDHWNCVPTDIYAQQVIGKWRQHREQKKLMLTSPDCKEWEFIRRSEPEDWMRKNDGR